MAKKGKQNWIFGKHAVEAALEFGRRPIYELWISHEEKELEHAARAKNIPLRFGNRKDFDKRFPLRAITGPTTNKATPITPVSARY